MGGGSASDPCSARYPGLGRSECSVAALPPARKWLDAPISTPSPGSSAISTVLKSVPWVCISCAQSMRQWLDRSLRTMHSLIKKSVSDLFA